MVANVMAAWRPTGRPMLKGHEKKAGILQHRIPKPWGEIIRWTETYAAGHESWVAEATSEAVNAMREWQWYIFWAGCSEAEVL